MKRIFILALGIAISFGGCQKRTRVVSLPAPTVPVSTAPVATAAITLESAERAFEEGNYAAAARAYQNYVENSAAGRRRDEALFRLGLIYASPQAPSRDWNRASKYLRQLIDEYPGSLLKSPAALILTLFTEVTQLRTDSQQRDQRIKQLSTELDKLKKIDAERRKR